MGETVSMLPKYSSDRTAPFARMRTTLVLLGLLAFNVRPFHTHQLLGSHSTTATIDHAGAPAFCFECAFGGDPVVVSRSTTTPVILGTTVSVAGFSATETSVTLPHRCGRAPPAL